MLFWYIIISHLFLSLSTHQQQWLLVHDTLITFLQSHYTFWKIFLFYLAFCLKLLRANQNVLITVIFNVLLSWCYSIWKSASLMANLQMLLVWLRAKGQEQDNDERHLCQHFVRNHWGSNKSIWNRNLIVCNKIMQKLLHKKINGNDHGRFDRKGLLLWWIITTTGEYIKQLYNGISVGVIYKKLLMYKIMFNTVRCTQSEMFSSIW